MTPPKQLILSAFALVLCLLVFQYTDLDFWIQNFLYDSANKRWLLANPAPIIHFVFYDGIKKLLLISAFCTAISLYFFSRHDWIKKYRQGLIIVLLSIVIVPSTIGLLKATTNVACPKAVIQYGGNIQHTTVFENYPADHQPAKRQHCFPAGHASGGFALMSLFYLFKSARRKKQAIAISIAIGWTMGGYKMLIGDHFFSHTLASMLIAWMLINAIVITRNSKQYIAKATLLAKPKKQS